MMKNEERKKWRRGQVRRRRELTKARERKSDVKVIRVLLCFRFIYVLSYMWTG